VDGRDDRDAGAELEGDGDGVPDLDEGATQMRFMIIVKASEGSETGALPDESMIARMAEFHEELARAGVLLDAAGLQPTASGWRIRYSADGRTVVDGPFSEAKEIVGGYTLIQARSREEALEWARRFPNPAGPGREAEIEVRPLAALDDLGEGPAIERFRALDLPSQGPERTST